MTLALGSDQSWHAMVSMQVIPATFGIK